MANKVYDIVTDKIIDELRSGVVPWHKPWRSTGGFPVNMVTKKPYRGVNILLLGMAGYSNPYWGTFKQITEAGGQVRKGEKSTLIVFFKVVSNEDDPDSESDGARYAVLRYYRVFNVTQADGLAEKFPAPERPEPVPPPEAVEHLRSLYIDSPRIVHDHNKASYSWVTDTVHMPNVEDFDTTDDYAATLFHELVHSTGHESRLNRDMQNTFGSTSYAKEELIAEVGTAFLCETYGIAHVAKSASYIESWIKRLSNDHTLIVYAAGRASTAVDYMMSRTEV